MMTCGCVCIHGSSGHQGSWMIQETFVFGPTWSLSLVFWTLINRLLFCPAGRSLVPLTFLNSVPSAASLALSLPPWLHTQSSKWFSLTSGTYTGQYAAKCLRGSSLIIWNSLSVPSNALFYLCAPMVTRACLFLQISQALPFISLHPFLYMVHQLDCRLLEVRTRFTF